MHLTALLKPAAPLLLSLTMLTACQTKKTLTYATDTRDVCSAFSAINYSRRDTRVTLRQVVGHNAAYDNLCSSTHVIVDRRRVCAIFSQITYSRTDTRDTVRNIIGHNATYGAICLAE